MVINSSAEAEAVETLATTARPLLISGGREGVRYAMRDLTEGRLLVVDPRSNEL